MKMVKKAKSSLRVENRRLIAKNAWKGVNKVLKTSIFKTSLKGKPGDKKPPMVEKTYGMLLESAGNGTIKIGKSFPEHYLQQDFINRVKSKYNRIIQEEEKKIVKDEVKNKSIEQIKKEKKDVIKRLERIELEGKINNLNNWLDRKCPGKKFIEREGKDYRLLIYRLVGPKDKIKLFCSKYYQPAFRNFIEIETSVKDEIDLRLDKTYHLQPLEKFLQEDVDKEPNFFRKVGPLWVDFESRYVVERDEVDEIINNLEENQFHLLSGDAASGKSTIARNVGYKLMKDGWNVFLLDPVSFQVTSTESLINELNSINNRQSLVIIEDIHRNFTKAPYVIERIRDKKTRFLLVIRDPYGDTQADSKIHIFDGCKRKSLEREDFSKLIEMIASNYIEHQKGDWKKKFRKTLMAALNEMESISGGNLWLFSYLLKAWNPQKGINIKIVYDQIKEDIEDLENEFIWKYGISGVADALLTLAFFSRFELEIPRSFLNEKTGTIKIISSILKRLEDYGEIWYRDGFFSIPHSVLAQLYYETATFRNDGRDYTYLIENITNQLGKKTGFSGNKRYFQLELAQAYLQTNPKNYGKFVAELCTYETGKRQSNRNYDLSIYEEERRTIKRYKECKNIPLKEILLDSRTSKSLIRSIRENDDLENLGLFLYGLDRSTKVLDILYLYDYTGGFNGVIKTEEKKIFTREIDIKSLISRIEREKNVHSLGVCFKGIAVGCDGEFHEKFIKKLNPSIVISKLESNNVLFLETAQLARWLIFIDDHFQELFKDLLIQKANSEKNLINLATGFFDLYYTKEGYEEDPKGIYREILNGMNLDVLLSKFEKEETLKGISLCLGHLNNVFLNNKKYSKHLMNLLSSKIDKNNNIYCILWCLGVVGSDEKMGVKRVNRLIDSIDIDLFTSKINDRTRDELGGAWLSFPARATKESLKLILDRLNLWEKMRGEFIHEANRILYKRWDYNKIEGCSIVK